jgi:hypothetical protein
VKLVVQPDLSEGSHLDGFTDIINVGLRPFFFYPVNGFDGIPLCRLGLYGYPHHDGIPVYFFEDPQDNGLAVVPQFLRQSSR